MKLVPREALIRPEGDMLNSGVCLRCVVEPTSQVSLSGCRRGGRSRQIRKKILEHGKGEGYTTMPRQLGPVNNNVVANLPGCARGRKYDDKLKVHLTQIVTKEPRTNSTEIKGALPVQATSILVHTIRCCLSQSGLNER